MLDDMCSFFGFLAVSLTLSIYRNDICTFRAIGGCVVFGCLHKKRRYTFIFNLPVSFGAGVTSLPVLAHEMTVDLGTRLCCIECNVGL
jgi:hypothetical protein